MNATQSELRSGDDPQDRNPQNRNSDKKTALVTGAAKRLGRSVAIALAQAGCDVVITYKESKREADETVDALSRRNVRAYAVPCDVRDPSNVRDAVAASVDLLGRLDFLVNNAGIFETAQLNEITVEQWDRVFETNTRGPFLMTQAAFPHLRAARGRIVNMGSLGGLRPWPTHAHYCASKAALHMLTATMAKSFAPEISVNCVAPGLVAPGQVDSGLQRLVQNTPMKRVGDPEDVAAAVLFFLQGPHFITGQILAVDGGLGL